MVKRRRYARPVWRLGPAISVWRLTRHCYRGPGAGRRRSAWLERDGNLWRRIPMPFVRGEWMRGVAAGAVALGLAAGLAGCGHVPFTGGRSAKISTGPDGSPTAIGV